MKYRMKIVGGILVYFLFVVFVAWLTSISISGCSRRVMSNYAMSNVPKGCVVVLLTETRSLVEAEISCPGEEPYVKIYRKRR